MLQCPNICTIPRKYCAVGLDQKTIIVHIHLFTALLFHTLKELGHAVGSSGPHSTSNITHPPRMAAIFSVVQVSLGKADSAKRVPT
jgi:hypothetical protein